MPFEFDVPDYKKIRVIVDTDAACEADDPFAIAHALLSPKFIVKGIIAEHFNVPGSMQRSYDEIMTILDAMGMKVPVYRGQEGPLLGNIGMSSKAGAVASEAADSTDAENSANTSNQDVSEAVNFIISEAQKPDDKPLFILCQGAITNVAKALQTEPSIKDKLTIIWIGTHGEAPCKAPFTEFNAVNDIEAANYVLQSGANVWLVPSHVYITINIGLAEIQRRIKPCGKIGQHLFQNMVDYNNSEGASWTQGESWSLGDSPAIAIAINPGCGHYHEAIAPLVLEDTSSAVKEDNPKIRIYTDVDSRYILEDFIAKLELAYGAEQSGKFRAMPLDIKDKFAGTPVRL